MKNRKYDYLNPMATFKTYYSLGIKTLIMLIRILL